MCQKLYRWVWKIQNSSYPHKAYHLGEIRYLTKFGKCYGILKEKQFIEKEGFSMKVSSRLRYKRLEVGVVWKTELSKLKKQHV